MNRLEKLLLRGAGYCVLFLILYFLLAAIMSFESITVSAGRFFLILLFAYILAMADFVFDATNLNVWLKRASVYAVSLAAFLIIFVFGGSLGTTAAKVFAAVIIFTAIYALCLAVIILILKTVRPASKKPAAKSSKSTTKKAEKYTPRYEE